MGAEDVKATLDEAIIFTGIDRVKVVHPLAYYPTTVPPLSPHRWRPISSATTWINVSATPYHPQT